MNRIVIITGGNINTNWAREYLRLHPANLVYAVDGGLKYVKKLGIIPDCIIGDFDTIDPEILKEYENKKIRIIRLIPEKDYTDTHTAVCAAMEETPDEIVIFGGVGSRIDHSLGNLYLLQMPLAKGIHAYIINENNKIYMINDNYRINADNAYGRYISLMPFGEAVTGLTLAGFKYQLNNYRMSVDVDISIGISNEIVDEYAEIKMMSGKLLVIEARD